MWGGGQKKYHRIPTALQKRKDLFDQLAVDKEAIDGSFAEPLEWQRLDGSRACRVRVQIDMGDYQDESKMTEIHDAMISAVIRLQKAFGPYANQLKISVVISAQNKRSKSVE